MRIRVSSRVFVVVLACIFLAEAVAVVAANAPGRANVDVAHSARQALGRIPYDDWHPPIMAALWQLLIDVTGSVASLFFLQVLVYFAAALAMALALWALAGRRRAALPILAFPLLPFVLTQLGMVWKDSLMAVSLFASLAALLLAYGWARERPRWRVALVVVALLFLLFGTMVRKNAAFAVVPLIVMALLLLWPRLAASRWWVRLGAATLAVAAFGAVVLGAGRAVDAAYDVRPTSQVSQVYLDDVIFSVPYEDLEASSAPAPLKERLMWAKGKCEYLGHNWDAYWNCYGRGAEGTNFSPIAYQDELRQLWWDEVASRPDRYLAYRASTYAQFLGNSSLEYWPTGWAEAADSVGLGPEESPAERAQSFYVGTLAVQVFPWLFLPSFWIVVGLCAFAVAVRNRRLGTLRWPTAAVAASGVLYLLGYFPIIPADHFRYTYWPAMTGTLSLALIATGLWRARAVPEPADA